MTEIRLNPIGFVKNNQTDDPRTKNWSELKSEIILNPDLVVALDGLEDYSHIVVIFWMHKVTERRRKLKKIPCRAISRKGRGVLATRVPYRPNPIGVTIVKLISVKGGILEVLGLDAFNGTPVLDIKPYTGHPRDLVLDFHSPDFSKDPK